MEAETKSPALKGDLIHQKYHKLMKTLIHNNIYCHLVHRRCGEFDCQSELTLRKFEHIQSQSGWILVIRLLTCCETVHLLIKSVRWFRIVLDTFSTMILPVSLVHSFTSSMTYLKTIFLSAAALIFDSPFF